MRQQQEQTMSPILQAWLKGAGPMPALPDEDKTSQLDLDKLIAELKPLPRGSEMPGIEELLKNGPDWDPDQDWDLDS